MTNRGRPRAASPALVQEAALELFTEVGYGAATVDAIATRAGVSRSTFFNYFTGKPDVFWLEIDAAITEVESALLDPLAPREPIDAARRAILDAADTVRAVPWVLSPDPASAAEVDIVATSMIRAQRLAAALTAGIQQRVAHPTALLAAPAAGAALAGATAVALKSWAAAGLGRGAAREFVGRAIDPVLRGFDAALAHPESADSGV